MANLREFASKRLEAIKKDTEGRAFNRPLLESLLFTKQLEFIRDPSRFKIARCSRRAGKTTGVAYYLRDVAMSGRSFNCLYLSSTRNVVKRLMWNEIKRIVTEVFKDDVKINESELSIYFTATNSFIYLKGVPDAKAAEKLRGDKFKLIVIDEAQSFPTYIKYLVNEVLSPSLMDLQGTLALTGTPNESCSGYFYDADHSDQWSKHSWLFSDNEFLVRSALENNKKLTCADDIIKSLVAESGKSIDDPSIQREYFGKWIASNSLAVYQYSSSVNSVKTKIDLRDSDTRVVLGIDTGFNDADAIVAIGYSLKHRVCQLLEEYKMSKQDITQLAERIKYFKDKYRPHTIVMDQGALGKKIADELNRRHSLAIIPAEKSEKFSFIKLLNSDLTRGYIEIDSSSQLAEEMRQLRFSEKHYKENIYKESSECDNHLCDAFLYAWRYVYTYCYKSKEQTVEFGSVEHFKQLEEKAKERYINENTLPSQGFTNRQNNSAWDTLGQPYGYGQNWVKKVG
jgi:hypothetical protein